MNKSIMFSVVALLAVATPACAFAQSVEFFSSPVETKFSGKGGGSVTLSKSDNDTAYVTSITAYERSDDPCHLEVGFSDINTAASAGKASFKKCAKSGSKMEGKDSSRETAEVPDGFYTIGVQICHNKNGDKMKALALIYEIPDCTKGEKSVTLEREICSRVFSQGSHEYRLCDTGGYYELQCSSSQARRKAPLWRPNCVGGRYPDSDWKRDVICPAGTVATGVILSTREGGGDREMVDGVALECRRFH